MADERLELRPTVDRRWLERRAEAEPLVHAHALWDLDRAPQSVRFVSVLRGETTVGYLLIWLGSPTRAIVHWYGPVASTRRLLEHFPAPPFGAFVPEEVVPLVIERYPAAALAQLELMVRPRDADGAEGPPARRLTEGDRAELERFLSENPEPLLSGYSGLDLAEEPAWGTFSQGRLTGLTRASVRLGRLWIVSGVFVAPAHRRRGVGASLVGSAVREATRHGADAGLFVRSANPGARRLYERLGFRTVARRSSLEVAAP